MIFTQPFWLIFLIPVLVILFKLKRKKSFILLVSLLILALAAPMIKHLSNKGTVVAVIDRSLSMPEGSQKRFEEIIELLQESQPDGWQFAVVSYGRENRVDKTVTMEKFPGFLSKINRHHSNLFDALMTAGQLIDAKKSGRVVVVSDGIWTGKDPKIATRLLASRGISVDYRCLKNDTHNDVQVTNIKSPVNVYPGEVMTLSADIYSPVTQTINYQIIRNGKEINKASKKVIAETTKVTWQDKATNSGCMNYSFKITPSQPDKITVNNEAKFLIGVKAQKPILCLTGNSDSAFADLLKRSGINVKVYDPSDVVLTLATLASYSAVIIENVPAHKIGEVGMANLNAWVKTQGGGLFLTGGRHAFGIGGYYKSPLEEALPVSLELRKEHRKLSMGLVVALDRSGSMGMRTPSGRTKMELASMATAQVYDMLSGTDELGVIAVDSQAHTIVPLSLRSTLGKSTRHRISSMNSQGGGIYVYNALLAASEMLIKYSKAGTKHIILFTDASDTEQPSHYQDLLERCTEIGITCSVIALGQDSDCHAQLCRDIAKAGQGRIFFTNNAVELPRLFAQDTMVVARNTFIGKPIKVVANPLLRTLGNIDIKTFELGGYNLCYLKPKASQAISSTDEYKAPVLAYWQYGSGRVACFAGEVNGKYTGKFKNHPKAGDLLATLTRWAAGHQGLLNENMALEQTLEKGYQKISLYVSPEFSQFTEKPKVLSLAGANTDIPKVSELEMDWVEPDKLEVMIPINPDETVLTTIDIPKMDQFTLSPVCLPNSPEYQMNTRDGKSELKKLATLSSGSELLNISTIGETLPPKVTWNDMTPWLLGVAAILFVMMIFVRRTGQKFTLPSINFKSFMKKAPTKPKKTKNKQKVEVKPSSEKEESPKTVDKNQSDVLSALSSVKKRK